MASESHRPTLLVVDDEDRILSALKRVLRREGFELLFAGSPSEALSLLAAHSIDFVLSDHKMPEMTGLELLERVAGRWPDVGRALITGWPEEVPAGRAKAAGILAVLPKPWDDAELKRLLHARLG